MKKRSMWMVRAGEGGFRFDEFKAQSLVSIGWHEVGDMSSLKTRNDFSEAMARSLPNARAGQIAASAGQTYRFVHEISLSDLIITYDREERIYLLGAIVGDYEYRPDRSVEHPNIRRVQWTAQVPRDELSVAARNSLGAISTLFLIPPGVAAEIETLSEGTPNHQHPTPTDLVFGAEADASEVDDLYKDVQSKGFEFIKDRVNALDWEEMQELVAGLLRAMGYKTRISPSGSDRGKDIVASPDGLGFEDPRIVVEVKHRAVSMGSQEIRSFLGGRHETDKGLYVSTGGFTKDARYEAERGRIPITLMDLDDLVKSLLEHYESMDVEMQRLVPLRKVYWPA